MTDAIVLDHLSCRFGDTVAVDDLSLSVRSGEVFGLLGHNGAGKTTTIRATTGIVEPAAGTVRVFGRSPATDGPALRARTAVLTEQPTLDERLTARETLHSFAELFGVPRDTARRRTGELLERFGLSARVDERVGSYSKGMRQRLAFCRALVHDPELLILDEPTAGLDPVATRQLHELVQEWSRDHRRTVVLCTHNLDEAQRLCERVAVMARGRLLGLGTPAELAARVGAVAELRVVVPAEQLAAAVAVVRAQATLDVHAVDGDTVTARHHAGAHDDDVAAELAAALVHAGVRLRALVPTPPSLSDVYFALQPEHALPADLTASDESLVEVRS
jgi:ABC-2 type transport system ATP-binding protein